MVVIPMPRLMTKPLRSMITDILMDTEVVAAAPKEPTMAVSA